MISRLLLFLLLLPSIALAQAGQFYRLDNVMGCHSFFAKVTCRTVDSIDFTCYAATIDAMFIDEVRTLYRLELEMYERYILVVEPVPWDDDPNSELWKRKYWPILNKVQLPEYELD
ncbi:MAG: hypothetical protein C0623_05040 [Desulfuromonas sp.]|nr:MAG: hypothetical protein C0623_05040 [Desulfuromonas sp.]